MSKFSVKKPFTVLVGIIVAVVLGFVSLTRMQLDLLPNVSLPYLLVITTYPGASPETVEANVCRPMEKALGTINGVENITSVCNENYGMVQLEFQDDTDLDSAMVKVSSALNTLQAALPDDCGTPSIIQISADMMASVYLAVSMDNMSIEETSKFVKDYVVPGFERQEGVASVTSMGLVDKTVQIELNEEKVDALNDKILASLDKNFEDALEQLEDAKKQLSDSQKELNKSKDKLIESQNELNESKQELIDGQKELDDGRREYNQRVADLDEGMEKLENAQNELNNKKKDTLNKLSEASVLSEKLSYYQNELATINAGIAQYDGMVALRTAVAASTDWDNERDGFLPSLLAVGIDASTLTQLEALGALNAVIGGITSHYGDLKIEKTTVETIISSINSSLSAQGVDPATVSTEAIEKAKMEASAGFGSADAQLSINKSTIESGKAQLDSAKKQLEQSQKTIDKGWESLADGQQQILEGLDSLKDGEKQIKDGWDDYYDAVKSFEKQRAEAVKKANADELLKLTTLAQLIYAQNFEMPAGYVDDSLDNSWLIKVGQKFTQVEELSDIVLCNIHNVGDVRISDVADIFIIDNADDSYVRLDGNMGIILQIFKSSTAGTNEISRVVQAHIEELTEEYPDIKVMVMVDQGDYINMIVKNVLQSMAIGAFLAIIILAIFLRDVRPTIVVGISIPLSVLSALIAMYFSNISLNMLSLSGLALGIGMLVDNSIVVIENIYRLRGKGVEAPRAAVQGTKQVAGAIIASTLTTVCVFLPMIYTTGLVRELMMPMCLTIIFCLMASLFVAMTVVPAASSTILRKTAPKKQVLFDKIQDVYGKILDRCLEKKSIVIATALGLLVLTGWLVMRMGIVMLPDITMNMIEADIKYPEDYDRNTCYRLTDEAMDKILTVAGIESVGIMAGDDTSFFVAEASNAEGVFRNMTVMVTLENPDAGKSEIKGIMADIENVISDMNIDFEISTASSEMDAMLGGSGLSINVYGEDLQELTMVSREVMDIVGRVEGYTNISNGEEDADKVMHLMVDKNKAMSLGLSVAQIYAEIADKIDNEESSVTMTVDGVEMDVKVVDNIDELTKENILDYTFNVEAYDEDDDKITKEYSLSEFADVEIKDGVAVVNRLNQKRYMTVTADVSEGENITLLTRKLKPLLEEYKMPDGYSYELGGEYDSVVTMIKQMVLVMLLGLLFIYLVMVVQFQSLLSPFIVLFTIPLAFTGGFGILWLTGENMSVISMMGFIVLMGTVVNNGIVFVDYTNQLRKGGLDRKTALIATGKTRMRPILMTALTTILAESNLIIGDDMGSQLGRGMALVIAGGLAYATLMTLFVIPVMYDILFKKQPLDVDTGRENLDDIPDDAAEYLLKNS